LGQFGKIWVKFDYVWAKIKIVNSQKHLNTYEYGLNHGL